MGVDVLLPGNQDLFQVKFEDVQLYTIPTKLERYSSLLSYYFRRHSSSFPVHSYTPLSIKVTFSFRLPFRAVFWEAKLSFFVESSDRNTPTSLKLLLNYQQRPTTHPDKYFPLPDNSFEAQRRIPAARTGPVDPEGINRQFLIGISCFRLDWKTHSISLSCPVTSVRSSLTRT